VEIKYMEKPFLHLKASADQLNELFRQWHPCKVSNGGSSLHTKFCVLNFELLGQFKKNNLPRTPNET
jgi:hypothetical protein